MTELSAPPIGPIDYVLTVKGKQLLRIERKSAIDARDDGATELLRRGLIDVDDYSKIEVATLEGLIKTTSGKTRARLRRVVKRIPYVMMEKPPRKPDPAGALALLGSALKRTRPGKLRTELRKAMRLLGGKVRR